MKKTLFTLAAFIAFSVCALAAPKILTVNMGQVYEGYWKAQDAQQKFNSTVQTAQEEIQQMARDGETLVNKFNELQQEMNSPAVSEDRKKQVQDQLVGIGQQIQQKQQEIQRFRVEQDQTLAQRRQTIINYNLQQIRETVAEVAAADKADLVLNTDGLAVIYSNDASDITKKVLDKLNADKPQTPAAK